MFGEGGDLVSEYMPSIPVPQKAEAGRMHKFEANLGHNELPSLKLDARSRKECSAFGSRKRTRADSSPWPRSSAH